MPITKFFILFHSDQINFKFLYYHEVNLNQKFQIIMFINFIIVKHFTLNLMYNYQ